MLLEEILNLPKNVKTKILEEFFNNYSHSLWCNLDDLAYFTIDIETDFNIMIEHRTVEKYENISPLHILLRDEIKLYSDSIECIKHYIYKKFNLSLINNLDFRHLEESTINYIITCLYDTEDINDDLLCTDTITYLENL